MRAAPLCVLLSAAACRAGVKPSVSLGVGAHAFESKAGQVEAFEGEQVRLSTDWSDTCGGGSDGINALGISPSSSERCHSVRHRVHLRCAEPCEIQGPGGTAANELTWGPTTSHSTFRITPRSARLSLQLVLEAGGDRRTIPLPAIRFLPPTEVVVECGQLAFASCENELSAERALQLRVQAPAGVSLDAVVVNGVAAKEKERSLPLKAFIPERWGPDGLPSLVPGDYRVLVEARAGERVIRRELTVRVRATRGY